VTGIKSMPAYRALQWDGSGRAHLAVARGAGGEALRRLTAEAEQAGQPGRPAAHILYVPEDGADLSEAVRGACPGAEIAVSTGALLARLGQLLAALPMGLRFYAAGDEDFLSQAARIAEQHGLDPAEMQCECAADSGTVGAGGASGTDRTSGARRVYCIHCRHCNGAVREAFVSCAGCGRKLLVRDHYSRRLAAFMGVMADAETPEAAA